MDSVRATGTNTNDTIRNNVLSRFIIYTLVVSGLTVSLPVIVGYGDIVVFCENGPIEWLEVGLLAVSAAVLLLSSRTSECRFRQLFYILSLLATFAAIRELDSILKKWIPVAGWTLPGLFCATTGIIIYWKERDRLAIQVAGFTRTRGFSLLWCGFVVAIPFAQLVGHGAFLQLLMGDDYVRDYKRVIEELGELLGYLFIFIGSAEAVFQRKQEGNAHVVGRMA